MEYEHKDDIKNVHFTEGGPWFSEYEKCDYQLIGTNIIQVFSDKVKMIDGFETRENTDKPVRALVKF